MENKFLKVEGDFNKPKAEVNQILSVQSKICSMIKLPLLILAEFY